MRHLVGLIFKIILLSLFVDETIGEDSIADSAPNIIMLVADDLGYNDVGWNNPEVKTPNLDELTKTGIILDQYYSLPNGVPSRAALMTGLYPFNTGNQFSKFSPTQPTGLNTSLILLPEYLRRLGYKTHMVGKWGLGFCDTAYLPTQRGFDTFSGFLVGGGDKYSHQRKDGSGYDLYHNQNPDISLSGNYSLDIILDRVTSVIENHQTKTFSSKVESAGCFEYNVDLIGSDLVDGTISNVLNFKDCQKYCSLRPDCNFWTWNPASFASNRLLCQLKSSDNGRSRPSGKISGPKVCGGTFTTGSDGGKLFLYVPFQNPHGPSQVPQFFEDIYADVENEKRQKFLGMVSAMDEAVGSIIRTLKSKNMFDETLFVFISDNGANTLEGGNNWPLRGGKGSLWEGGTRVPSFLSGEFLPKSVQGTTSSRLFHVTDWIPTLLEAVTPNQGLKQTLFDGVNQWNSLISSDLPEVREELVYNIEEITPSAAIRVGSMKLVINPNAESGISDWVVPPEGNLTIFEGAEDDFSLGVEDYSCMEENINFAGFGIPNNRINEIFSADECKSECQLRAECQFWTWNSGSYPVLSNTCWLKSSDSGRKERKGKTSGPRECQFPLKLNLDLAQENKTETKSDNENNILPDEGPVNTIITTENTDKKIFESDESDKACVEEDTNYAGYGISDNRVNEIYSPEDCQIQCQSRPDCEFWTWNSKDFPLHPNTCWLKSSDLGRKLQKGKASGPSECKSSLTNILSQDVKENEGFEKEVTACFEGNTSYPGNGINKNKIENILSSVECQNQCVIHDNCTHWTWNSPTFSKQPNTCFLKSAKSASVKRRGKISGPKSCGRGVATLVRKERQIDEDCFETGTNYAGFGIPDNKIEKIASAQDCQSECAIRVGCFFWTWNTEASSRFPNTCWLKSSDTGRKTGVEKISGPRSCSSLTQTLDPEQNISGNKNANDETSINFLLGKTLRLYNLTNDPEERNNLAADQPDLAQQLLARLLEHAKTLVERNEEKTEIVNSELEYTPGWCTSQDENI